jgi:DNA-binding CsgD family transcriptional regulator
LPPARSGCDNRSVTALAQLRHDLDRLARRDADIDEFARTAARLLGRAVPFDGICLVTMDPATSLPTGEFVQNGLPEATRARMAEIEGSGEDYHAFGALSRSEPAVGALSAATRGDLSRSVRHRELRAPHGFGDELRAALSDEHATWGGLTLLRGDDQPSFTDAEVGTVASLLRALTQGVRRSLLATDALLVESGEHMPAGVLVLDADNAVVTSDAAADAWLKQLLPVSPRRHVPPLINAVAARARTLLQDSDDRSVAQARVRATNGAWLVVRASTLDADDLVAVTFEPARPLDLAPLMAEAYELTARERAVTRLVAQGLSTRAIAERLYLSSWTVQDHLKAIFEKVGVTTRGELVARVFFGHRAPHL